MELYREVRLAVVDEGLSHREAAHLFIIHSAAKSSITPPVAVASNAAAAVAGCDPRRTSLVAFRLGLSVFIIPYMFVYGEALLSYGHPAEVAWTFFIASFGLVYIGVRRHGLRHAAVRTATGGDE